VKFSEAIAIVLKHEGGYVNDPDDPGGETNYGISKRSFPKYDIKNLTEDDAKDIYKQHYWDVSKAQKLKDELRLDYFDMCVNMGQRTAVKCLQKATNNAPGTKIAVDGRIGPNTIKESKRVSANRLRSFRVLYYAKLIMKKPTLEKYYYGWFKRSLQCQ
jgi:lysozyme family protein